MDVNQIGGLVIVIQALVIVALLLVVYGQGKQLGGSYPAEIKSVLGALAGLAVFFSARTSTPVDDGLVKSLLLPVFGLLGIPVPVMDGTQAGSGAQAVSAPQPTVKPEASSNGG